MPPHFVGSLLKIFASRRRGNRCYWLRRRPSFLGGGCGGPDIPAVGFLPFSLWACKIISIKKNRNLKLLTFSELHNFMEICIPPFFWRLCFFFFFVLLFLPPLQHKKCACVRSKKRGAAVMPWIFGSAASSPDRIQILGLNFSKIINCKKLLKHWMKKKEAGHRSHIPSKSVGKNENKNKKSKNVLNIQKF